MCSRSEAVTTALGVTDASGAPRIETNLPLEAVGSSAFREGRTSHAGLYVASERRTNVSRIETTHSAARTLSETRQCTHLLVVLYFAITFQR